MVESRLAVLEKKVEELEDKLQRMLKLTAYEKHPFTYLSLERHLTKEQIDGIFNLMDEVSKALMTGQKTVNSSAEFEKRVYTIVPESKGDYHFAADIVGTFNESNQYQDVYRYMKKVGMNLP